VTRIDGATTALLSRLAAVRRWLARLLGLRWASPEGLDLIIPVAIVMVVLASLGQIGGTIGGFPAWLLWPPLTAVGALGLRLRPFGRESGWLGSVLVAGIVVLWVLDDILHWGVTNHLYDLNVYLGSSARWLDGGQPYMTAPISSWPASAQSDYFLYPPPLLPVFGLLSRLPNPPVAAGWTLAMAACAYKAFRFLGLSRAASLAMLAFPPVTIGFESGNVASLTFLLFAASVRAGGTLVVDGLFKAQSGVPALWLIREGRWRGILAGSACLGAIVLVTLPLVGLNSWADWWRGLDYRAASQAAVPAMFGYSYAAWLSGAAYVILSAALVGLALLLRGRAGLAALGLASIFASPALWAHGFVFAVPALLMLENGTAVWLMLGVSAVGQNMWLLFYVGWLSVLAARRRPSGRLHPLAGTDGPWPSPAAFRPRRQSAGQPFRVGSPPPAP